MSHLSANHGTNPDPSGDSRTSVSVTCSAARREFASLVLLASSEDASALAATIRVPPDFPTAEELAALPLLGAEPPPQAANTRAAPPIIPRNPLRLIGLAAIGLI